MRKILPGLAGANVAAAILGFGLALGMGPLGSRAAACDGRSCSGYGYGYGGYGGGYGDGRGYGYGGGYGGYGAGYGYSGAYYAPPAYAYAAPPVYSYSYYAPYSYGRPYESGYYTARANPFRGPYWNYDAAYYNSPGVYGSRRGHHRARYCRGRSGAYVRGPIISGWRRW